jgi:hypothetical protein
VARPPSPPAVRRVAISPDDGTAIDLRNPGLAAALSWLIPGLGQLYQGRTFKHILVPIWLVSYTYGAKSFQVVVNGYNGKMAGEHPLSWMKITLAVIAVILIVLVIAMLNQNAR